MSQLPYSSWKDQNLRHQTVDVAGKRMSYWVSEYKPDRTTLLFVHGISGDHTGLIPLAYEFRKSHNLVFLDLPGHGQSEFRPLKHARDLQEWFDQALIVLAKSVGSIDWVIAHSFGCSAVVRSAHAKSILLCPVPSPSRLYRQYARITLKLAPFWALFYNARPLILMRGAALRKIHSRDAGRRVRWAGIVSRATYSQIVYQARLVTIIFDTTAYSAVSSTLKLVICGLEDTTAKERDTAELKAIFTKAPVEFLRGGHLLPIECPERVADQMRQVL